MFPSCNIAFFFFGIWPHYITKLASVSSMSLATGRHVNIRLNARKRANDGEDRSFRKEARIGEKIDKTRWRLKDDDSRHTWQYLDSDTAVKERPQTNAEKYFLSLPLVNHSCPQSMLCSSVRRGCTYHHGM